MSRMLPEIKKFKILRLVQKRTQMKVMRPKILADRIM